VGTAKHTLTLVTPVILRSWTALSSRVGRNRQGKCQPYLFAGVRSDRL